jgi:hypothetical protein
MQTLPEVAKSFQQDCKKCDTLRFHRVLAHIDATSAKVECETCKKKSTLKIGAAAKPKRKAATKKKVTTAAKVYDWQKMLEGNPKPGRGYSIKEKFANKEKIEHPKFGVGFIIASVPGRLTALFESEEKTLVQG